MLTLVRNQLLQSRHTMNAFATRFCFLSFFFGLTACTQNHGANRLEPTLLESPLQEVTLLANSGIIPGTKKYGADGISVAENGDVYVSGNLFVADYQASEIKRVTPDGTVSTFASGLDGPAGIYIDSDDNVIVGLYGAKYSGKGATVLRIAPDGSSSVLAQGNGLQDVIGVTGDEHGEVYAGNYKGRQLYKVSDGKATLLAASSVKINMIDYSRGYVYIANDGRIVRINTSTGEETLFSGTSEANTVNGLVANAEYVMPTSLAFSPDENILYVVDQTTGDIRKIARKK